MSTVVNKIELTANYYRNTGNKRITRGMKCLKQKTMNKRTKTTHRHPRLIIKLISTYDKNGWLATTGLKLIVVKAYSPFTLFSSNATSNSSFLFSNFKFSCFKSNALYCSARTWSWVTLVAHLLQILARRIPNDRIYNFGDLCTKLELVRVNFVDNPINSHFNRSFRIYERKKETTHKCASGILPRLTSE